MNNNIRLRINTLSNDSESLEDSVRAELHSIQDFDDVDLLKFYIFEIPKDSNVSVEDWTGAIKNVADFLDFVVVVDGDLDFGNSIEVNKLVFETLYNKIDREGADLEKLTRQLCRSDFYKAPASTKYHGGYPGGLCDHSLNVYFNLKAFALASGMVFEKDSMLISALFHDMSKMNFYESYNRNVKQPNGEWTQELDWRTREYTERFIFGSHSQNSEYMIRTFIPLTIDESAAILAHMGGKDSSEHSNANITEIFTVYPLATMLHLADMKATFIDEK